MTLGRNITLTVAMVAGLAMAGLMMIAPASAAGKIKEKYYGPSHGTPLGDPPDAEIDKLPLDKKKSPKSYRSTENYADEEYYEGSVKDDYEEPRYSRRSHKYKRGYDRRCVHPRDIRYGLKSDGWYDFAGYGEVDGVICLRARRRDNGRLYELELDNCSGLIVSAKPVRYRGYRSYRRNRWLRDRRRSRWLRGRRW